MIVGETVKVSIIKEIGKDAFNAPIYETEWISVDDVLVVPGSTKNLIDSNRQFGSRVVYTLHFPKVFNGSLRGSLVEVRGEQFRVIGDPKPYQTWNCPTRWNMPVEVENVEG